MAAGFPTKANWASGDILTAAQMDDLAATVNLLSPSGITSGYVLTANGTANSYTWAAAATSPTSYGYTAGKNKIINGDFYINQRNFTSNTTAIYGFDRWAQAFSGGTSVTNSAQVFTPGTAPVAGYEGKNYNRQVTVGQSAAGDYAQIIQRIESVRTLANQTATISFWAKAASGTPKISVELQQNFGTGGSPSTTVVTNAGQVTLSTSWARYSVTVSVPSISGATFGTNNDDMLVLALWTSAGSTYAARTGSIGTQNNTFDLWGVQVEPGSTMTSFQTATGTLQGELAACQRYYWRASVGAYNYLPGTGSGNTTTSVLMAFPLHQTMRVSPTSVDFSAICFWDGVAQSAVATSAGIQSGNADTVIVFFGVTSGITVYRPYLILTNATGYIGLNAEL